MKVTYLLGAGASAHAVPTSAYMNSSIRVFLDELISVRGKVNLPLVEPAAMDEMLTRMTEEASVLWSELKEHKNVDVYGRQLYLTHQLAKSRQLKALVSAFLIFHQLENGIDKRYDQFLANILDKNDKLEVNFPMELLLLSWNYDFQLEMAASSYLRQNFTDKIQELMSFFPRVQVQDLEREMLNKFSVIKLNGTVAGTLPDEINFLPLTLAVKPVENHPAETLRKIRLAEAIAHYNRYSDKKSNAVSNIMYAWEVSSIQKRMRSYLKYKSYNTDVLVVVGYSFPTFNRRFDRELLANMQLLKEVCIQAPSNEIQGIADRFYALLGYERVLGMGKSNNPVKVRLLEMKSEKLDEEFYVPFQASTF